MLQNHVAAHNEAIIKGEAEGPAVGWHRCPPVHRSST